MKKGLLIMLALALVATVTVPALSYADGHGGHHYNGWGYAGAAVGGLLLGTMIGSALAPPVYYAPPPPPVYYAPPPPPPRVYYYPAPRAYYYPAPPPVYHRHYGYGY